MNYNINLYFSYPRLETNENWNLPPKLEFKNQKIVDISYNDTEEQMKIHLENGTTISHTNSYGDKLFIENEKCKFENKHIYQ